MRGSNAKFDPGAILTAGMLLLIISVAGMAAQPVLDANTGEVQQADGEMYVCNGVFGCGDIQPTEWFSLAAIAFVVTVIGAVIPIRQRRRKQ